MPIKIQTLIIKNYPEVVSANYVMVRNMTINPGIDASATIAFFSGEEGNMMEVFTRYITMTPEQYQSWGTEDSYAVDTFITNAGLTKE